jgi:hypothetical protein
LLGSVGTCNEILIPGANSGSLFDFCASDGADKALLAKPLVKAILAKVRRVTKQLRLIPIVLSLVIGLSLSIMPSRE